MSAMHFMAQILHAEARALIGHAEQAMEYLRAWAEQRARRTWPCGGSRRQVSLCNRCTQHTGQTDSVAIPFRRPLRRSLQS